MKIAVIFYYSYLYRGVTQKRKRTTVVLFLLLVSFIPAMLFAADLPPIPDWNLVDPSPFNLITPLNVTNPVLTANDIVDVPAQFVADPFLFHEDGQWYMFFEVLRKDTLKGEIGLATSLDGRKWQYEGIVLSEDWHLSYPLVLKHNGEYYMIPESNEIKEVRLYQAVDFPHTWTYRSTIANGHFVDASVFYHDNMWWIFMSAWGDCFLYFSENLNSEWIEHPMSPIVRDDKSMARPGGRSFVFNNGRIIRVAQKDDVTYGEQVRVFEVDILTTADYLEHELYESPILNKTGGGWNASGMHHFDPWWTGDQWLCAVDGINGDTWSIGIYVTPKSGECPLDSRFLVTTLSNEMEYYADRNYKLTSVPLKYIGMNTIMTPNDDRNRTDATGYLTFELSSDATVYVAYDRRNSSLPNFMRGFTYTGDNINTSLSAQKYLRVYERKYARGECVNLGANYAPGSSGENMSNYLVFYDDTDPSDLWPISSTPTPVTTNGGDGGGGGCFIATAEGG